MNGLLKIEVAVLVLLVLLSVFVRVGITGEAAQTLQQPESTESSASSEVTEPQPSESESTEPEQTEPEETEPQVVLTFGEDFSLASPTYFVYDCAKEETLLVSGDPTAKVYPASVTKLFTAYVALQYLEPDTVVTLTKEVYTIASDSSISGVKPGQSISVRNLVMGMMLPSGNDAAYGLAVAAARVASGDPELFYTDALSYFVDMMNDTAQALGFAGSNFCNPDGYHDANHYTCAQDLMVIGKLALENALIRECVSTVRMTVPFGEPATWKNTNSLIDSGSQYYCEAAIGLKTGHTGSAGFCLLSAFTVEGNDYVIGSFGCERPEDRFIDCLKLYDVLSQALTEE